MARAHISKPILDAVGNVRTGASVRVLQPGTVTPVTDLLYAASVGSAVRTNPFVATNGVVDFYLAAQKRVRLGVTVGQEGEVFFEDVDILLADPSDGGIQVDDGIEVVPNTVGGVATCLILHDTAGVRWKITVGTTGNLTTEVAP